MIERESVFIDTAGWVALSNTADEFHTIAKTTYKQLRMSQITTDNVLIETCNLLSKLPLRPLASRLMERIKMASDLGFLELVHVSPDLLEKGWDLFKSRRDNEWSLTDCTSFTVMELRNIKKSFTIDHHFEQAGFQVLLK